MVHGFHEAFGHLFSSLSMHLKFEIELYLVKKIMRNQPRQAFEHLQSWMVSRVTTFVEKQPRLKSQSNVAELLAILNDDNNEVGL